MLQANFPIIFFFRKHIAAYTVLPLIYMHVFCNYTAPVVSEYISHEITRDFVLPTIFPLLRAVKAGKVNNITTTELIKTGPRSYGETDFEELKKGASEFDDKKDIQGPVSVAVVSTKGIHSEKEQKSKNGDKKDPSNTFKNNKKAYLVVIGDSDFASNQYFNFSGNSDLFLNTASFLAEEENLVSIRPKERKSNPLSITRSEGMFFLMLGLLAPSLVIFIGTRIWWRRRRL